MLNMIFCRISLNFNARMKIKVAHFFLLAVLCVLPVVGQASQVVGRQHPQDLAVLDLRNESFSDELKLDGKWNFYWKQLINPGDTTSQKGILVDFPFRWDGFVLDGEELPAYGYATYTVRVLLPPSSKPFRIMMTDVYTAYRLFINGNEVA